MGKRGPAPQPTNLRLLRGETRPSRVNLNEPKPPLAAKVEAPDYLDDDARAIWDRLAPSMRHRGVLTAWDVDLFAAFCTAVMHHRRAVAAVNTLGMVLEGENGPVKNPALQVVRDQAQLMTSIGGRFGLTPSDRSSISLEPEGDPDGQSASSVLD